MSFPKLYSENVGKQSGEINVKPKAKDVPNGYVGIAESCINHT